MTPKDFNRPDAPPKQKSLEITPDLLKAHPGAHGRFEAFPRFSKRAILEWIVNAKTEARQAKRLGETATLASGNVRANHWVGKK